MNAVRAVWRGGRIVPAEPVNWPEGSELLVEPVDEIERNGIAETEWGDDPASIEAWVTAVDRIEPLSWEKGEFEEFERFREESRQRNIEAVRKQMEALSGDDGP